jgi:hypothetical protein
MDESSVDTHAKPQVAWSRVAALLLRALDDIERYEQHLPCVLVCTDLSGMQTFSGPFPTWAAGQWTLEHELASAGRDSQLVFSLQPLYPALQLRR